MIVTFFVLFNCLLSLLKDKFKEKVFQENDNSEDSSLFSDVRKLSFEGDADFEDGGLRFFPPVYIQRYRAVVDVLQCQRLRGSIKKIVDFGCGEVSFFSYIKHLEGVEEYIGVDIDEETLKSNYSKVIPLTADYLAKRCTPFKVTILKGSVVDPDIRLENTDTVIAIELIEHMYPPELNELPYNIFGIINPQVAVFTTPNSDFNILFDRFEGFRHPDHKFEWSRSQFEDWANNLTVQYPDYKVVFHGIGKGPQGTENLGCCSQMAVFLRTAEKRYSLREEYSELHERIYGVDYPFQTFEQRLNDILEYEVYHSINKFSENEDYLVGEKLQVPIDDFIQTISIQVSVEKILEFLRKEQKEVEYINNKATLILPYDSEEKSWNIDYEWNGDSTAASVCGELDAEQEYWDVDTDIVSDNIMKSAESEDKDSAWESYFPESESRVAQNGNVLSQSEGGQSKCESPEQVPFQLTNTELLETSADDSKLNKTGTDCDKTSDTSNIFVKQELNESEKLCSTGAIPKQHGTSSSTVSPNRSPGIESIFEKHPERLFSSAKTNSLLNGSGGLFAESPGKSGIVTQSTPSQSTKGDCSSQMPILHSSQVAHPLEGSNPWKQGVESRIIKKITLGSKVVEKHPPDVLIDAESQNSSLMKEVSGDEPSSSVQRSHSLENINVQNSKNKSFRYSLNIDSHHIDCDTRIVDMELEVYGKGSSVPSLTDTFGSQSKAADSGYPNSAHDMEMDLTPEQVDEIITETESSLEDEESSGDERLEEQVQGNNAPVVFLDNVENGDVANNNRDGEGNNMEGGELVEEILGFEGMAAEGGEVEAGQHDSDDEGLYLSALDVSNDTLVPEESSSQDPAAFDSAFDLPSSSSFIRPSEVEEPAPPLPLDFPSWLLDILVNDIHPASGDTVNERRMPDRSSSSSSESVVFNSNTELVEVIVPGDTMGGGEPPPFN